MDLIGSDLTTIEFRGIGGARGRAGCTQGSLIRYKDTLHTVPGDQSLTTSAVGWKRWVAELIFRRERFVRLTDRNGLGVNTSRKTDITHRGLRAAT
jgi:hypothetical protein